jgi:hypothetical protein
VPVRAGFDDGEPTLSILIEFDNAQRKGAIRASRALRAIAHEIGSAAPGSVEVLVGFRGDRTPDWIADLVSSSIGMCPFVRTELVPAGERRYYEIKNHLARRARGTILVFVDCDVIVQPGWLDALVASFERQDVEVVGGWSYVGPLESRYTRCVAAAWTLFDPQPATSVSDVGYFKANNVAFRRTLFLEKPFPFEPDHYRGACAVLARDLAASGIEVAKNNSAITLHPPLAFPTDLVAWSVLTGRDRALRWADLPEAEFRRNVRRWIGAGYLGALRASWTRRRICQLSPAEVPGAMCIASAMWTCRLIGVIVCHRRPASFRKWL